MPTRLPPTRDENATRHPYPGQTASIHFKPVTYAEFHAYRDLFDDLRLPTTPKNQYFSLLWMAVVGALIERSKERPGLPINDSEAEIAAIAMRLGTCACSEDTVGRVYDALAEMGLAEVTRCYVDVYRACEVTGKRRWYRYKTTSSVRLTNPLVNGGQIGVRSMRGLHVRRAPVDAPPVDTPLAESLPSKDSKSLTYREEDSCRRVESSAPADMPVTPEEIKEPALAEAVAKYRIVKRLTRNDTETWPESFQRLTPFGGEASPHGLRDFSGYDSLWFAKTGVDHGLD